MIEMDRASLSVSNIDTNTGNMCFINRIRNNTAGFKDNYIREKTKTTDSEGKEVFPITLTFDEPTFRALITLEKDYRLDLTKSNFYRLIGFKKEILTNERNVGSITPNISEDTDVLNIHCDLISDSLVDGQESDIIFSFGTGTLQSSYNFVNIFIIPDSLSKINVSKGSTTIFTKSYFLISITRINIGPGKSHGDNSVKSQIVFSCIILKIQCRTESCGKITWTIT